MESEHLQNFDVSWGHEPGSAVGRDVRIAPLAEIGGALGETRPALRFMGSRFGWNIPGGCAI
jgi:hypothetical protein